MKLRISALILTVSTLWSVSVQPQEPASGPVSPQGQCELHVFPTENYIGLNSGLLSGFGIVGAVVDFESHKNRVLTVKELMAGYLGPDIQMDELNKIGLVEALGLTPNYQIIVEPPTPSGDEAKADPAVKAQAKAMNATIKAGKRLTASTNPCYAELLIFNVFYHKAMMYGSNLFVGTMFRHFASPNKPPVVSAGAVKNPLENFPPKSPEMIDAAKEELREAFAKDFIEWSQKKLAKPEVVAAK
jgi:hypothetical protein